MIDKRANRRWQAAPGGENKMDDPFPTLPLRKQPNQRAAYQRVATRMVGQQRYPHSGRRRDMLARRRL